MGMPQQNIPENFQDDLSKQQNPLGGMGLPTRIQI